VLDLEGKEEIIELPVLALRSADMQVIGRFHRWVRPVHLFEDVKGGHHNLQSNAIPFVQALPELMDWVLKMEESCGHPSAFVTCGNWDIKSQIPRQCKLSKIDLPSALYQWVNLKDIFNEFHQPRKPVRGMKGMLGRLQLKLDGMHHLGMDDVDNIAKCAIKLMQQGASLHITGKLAQ
jgi:3'-5' exoribonuclease 1